MPYVLLRHTITDYDEFRAIYDDAAPFRRMRGAKAARLFRSADDPKSMFMLFEWDELEKARSFAQGHGLQETMKWAGVVGEYEIHVLEEIVDRHV